MRGATCVDNGLSRVDNWPELTAGRVRHVYDIRQLRATNDLDDQRVVAMLSGCPAVEPVQPSVRRTVMLSRHCCDDLPRETRALRSWRACSRYCSCELDVATRTVFSIRSRSASVVSRMTSPGTPRTSELGGIRIPSRARRRPRRRSSRCRRARHSVESRPSRSGSRLRSSRRARSRDVRSRRACRSSSERRRRRG